MKLETNSETIVRMIACHSAFHSPDGREIKTEKITEGLVWEMINALKFYGGSWEGHAGNSGLGGNDPQDPECWPNEELADDAGTYARALLAKLEE